MNNKTTLLLLAIFYLLNLSKQIYTTDYKNYGTNNNNKTKTNVIEDNKKPKKKEIIIFANGDSIVNVSGLFENGGGGDGDGESNESTTNNKNNNSLNTYEYSVTLKQIGAVNNNNKNKSEKDLVRSSAQLAAAGIATLISSNNEEKNSNNNKNNNEKFMVSLQKLLKSIIDSNATDSQNNSIEINSTNVQFYKMLLTHFKDDSTDKSDNEMITAISYNQSTNDAKKHNYDQKGAVMYIWVVVLFYALVVLFLLISRVKPTFKLKHDDKDREKAEQLFRRMEEYTVTTKILEELRNEDYRKRAWAIYKGDNVNVTNEEKHSQREETTLKNLHYRIEKINKSKIDIMPELADSTYAQSPRVQKMIGLHHKKRRMTLIPKMTSSNVPKHSKQDKEQTKQNFKEWAKAFEFNFRAKVPASNNAQTSSNKKSNLSNKTFGNKKITKLETIYDEEKKTLLRNDSRLSNVQNKLAVGSDELEQKYLQRHASSHGFLVGVEALSLGSVNDTSQTQDTVTNEQPWIRIIDQIKSENAVEPFSLSMKSFNDNSIVSSSHPTDVYFTITGGATQFQREDPDIKTIFNNENTNKQNIDDSDNSETILTSTKRASIIKKSVSRSVSTPTSSITNIFDESKKSDDFKIVDDVNKDLNKNSLRVQYSTSERSTNKFLVTTVDSPIFYLRSKLHLKQSNSSDTSQNSADEVLVTPKSSTKSVSFYKDTINKNTK